jgi:predicted oxidoreductase
MNLESAIGKHAEWKVKFRTAISKHQQMDIAHIGDIHACEFGAWLDSDGKKQNRHLPEFSNLVEIHKHFHREAVKVATLINVEKYIEAETALSGASYSDASKQMASGVMKLKKAVPVR